MKTSVCGHLADERSTIEHPSVKFIFAGGFSRDTSESHPYCIKCQILDQVGQAEHKSLHWMPFMSSRYTKIDFVAGPGPNWGGQLTALPQTPSWMYEGRSKSSLPDLVLFRRKLK